MTVFADASAVVELFVSERGSEQVAAEAEVFALSALTRVEVASALWMKSRTGELAVPVASQGVEDALRQLSEGRFASGAQAVEVPVSASALREAARLCGVHGLRAGDAIHLATALAVRDVDPGSRRFWVFDQRLADAAATEGFMVVGPNPDTARRT